MTTIVYDNLKKIIACDSRVTSGSMIITDKGVKWKKAGDGSVWFFAGNLSDNEDLIKLSHNDKPAVEPGCDAIYAKNGCAYIVTFDNGYCCHTRLDYNHSIGSGCMFALSALDFSLSASEAVRYSSRKDSMTGGRVKSFDVRANEFI